MLKFNPKYITSNLNKNYLYKPKNHTTTRYPYLNRSSKSIEIYSLTLAGAPQNLCQRLTFPLFRFFNMEDLCRYVDWVKRTLQIQAFKASWLFLFLSPRPPNLSKNIGITRGSPQRDRIERCSWDDFQRWEFQSCTATPNALKIISVSSFFSSRLVERKVRTEDDYFHKSSRPVNCIALIINYANCV